MEAGPPSALAVCVRLGQRGARRCSPGSAFGSTRVPPAAKRAGLCALLRHHCGGSAFLKVLAREMPWDEGAVGR